MHIYNQNIPASLLPRKLEIFSFFSGPWVCECAVTFATHGPIFMMSLFIQHSYENILTSLSILAFLHHITLHNCVFSNVYTLNLKYLVYISSDKKHEVKIPIAQWLTYLLKCFLHISYSYLLAIRRRFKMQFKSISAYSGMWMPLFQDNLFCFILKKGKDIVKKCNILHFRMVRCHVMFLH